MKRRKYLSRGTLKSTSLKGSNTRHVPSWVTVALPPTEKLRGSGGLPPENIFKTTPYRTSENALLGHGRTLLSSFIIVSEGP